jgi:hypothetical protein
MRVLYHEAFHQYIYYAFGAFSPHSWFNEGHGDYFAGFEYRGRFIPDKFKWRQGIIKNAIATDGYVPLKDFVRYTQQQYYSRASLCYAQGWSLVYFLRHARDAKYREILPKYFEVLKRELGGDPEEEEGDERLGGGFPMGERGRAQKALDKAVDEAFEGIDFDELERDWKNFKF